MQHRYHDSVWKKLPTFPWITVKAIITESKLEKSVYFVLWCIILVVLKLFCQVGWMPHSGWFVGQFENGVCAQGWSMSTIWCVPTCWIQPPCAPPLPHASAVWYMDMCHLAHGAPPGWCWSKQVAALVAAALGAINIVTVPLPPDFWTCGFQKLFNCFLTVPIYIKTQAVGKET